MNTNIAYRGYSAVPSDYDCQDGELASSINFVPEDGMLRPIIAPKVIKTLEDTSKSIVFIHDIPGQRRNYFISTPAGESAISLSWFISTGDPGDAIPLEKPEQTSPGSSQTAFNNFLAITAVGNTVIVYTSTGPWYFLWKDGEYLSLGSHIPDIAISFGLVGHPRFFSQSDSSHDTFDVDISSKPEKRSGKYGEFSEDDKSSITSQVMAKVNRFVQEQSIDSGRFCLPFYLRYAIRLFDGSLVMHSSPILMNPTTVNGPIVTIEATKIGHETSSGFLGWATEEVVEGYKCDISLVAADLDFEIIDTPALDSLERWKDLIKSVDVFVSKPIYPYDINKEIQGVYEQDGFNSKFIGRLYAEGNPTSGSGKEDKLLGRFDSLDFLNYYSEWGYDQIYAMYRSPTRGTPPAIIPLPAVDSEMIDKELRSVSTFYLLKSIDISELLTYTAAENTRTRQLISIPDDYLQSLLTREVMTDDYQSHDTLVPTTAYPFNSRLNLSGVKRNPFKGFIAQTMFPYLNANHTFEVLSGNVVRIGKDLMASGAYSIDVYIRAEGKIYKVTDSFGETSGLFGGKWALPVYNVRLGNASLDSDVNQYKRSWGAFLFYPDVNAYKMVIRSGGNVKFSADLRPHDFLNGAYGLIEYDSPRPDKDDMAGFDPGIIPSDPSQTYIPALNKVYTSEVNNPFYFPLGGINSVGTGTILSICTAAKALSQGQFGQFPLYAFTDEGVWAMETSSTGTYTARQPITRDVCVDPQGITQIDSSVLFPTDRGIMLISGSQTQCISDSINSDSPFDITVLAGIDTLCAPLRELLPHTPSPKDTIRIAPFSRFMRGCRMIYDYVHQRIIVYNADPSYRYAYVFAMKSKQWGMLLTNITSGVNSYPEALAVDDAGHLIDFTQDNDDGKVLPGLIISRPIKLGDGDLLKTVDTVIQRGNFRKGHVQSVLYGSRDLQSWHPVWSSKDHYLRGFRGTPYKYFRIALTCRLDADESISGASIQFTPRLTNQPR